MRYWPANAIPFRTSEVKCVGGIAPLYGPFFLESARKVDKIAKQLWLQVHRKAGRMSI